MKKKVLSLVLALCMVLSLLPSAAFAASGDVGLTMLHIKDASSSYSAFKNSAGKVYDLNDSTDTQETFSYDVPEGGLTVLIFFRSVSCTNSDKLFDEISETEWAKNELVNIVAVESQRSNKDTVSQYMNTHDTNNVVDKVYYNATSSGTAFWYATLVSKNGDMTDVSDWGNSSFSAAYVLLITEEDNTKYIEYSLPGVDTVTYLSSYIQEFITTSDETSTEKTVNVTVPGNMRYDYAQQVFTQVNSNRSSNNVGTLTLSGQLTELAMQRAAELSVYYDHTRPNRNGAFSVNGESIGGSTVTYEGLVSENIAMGQTSPETVMNTWMSSTMGHKENILNENHTQVGVGCFENNGTLYWVQLFGTGSDSTSPSATGSVAKDVSVESSTARLNLSLSSASDITIQAGGTITAPKLINTNKGNSSFSAILKPALSEIKNDDGTVLATIVYGAAGSEAVQLKAASTGTANVVFAAYEGQTDAPSVKLTVNGISLTKSMFTVDTTDETYNGSEKTKTITTDLTKNTDYTVTYSDNTNAGTATITITGKGLYFGEQVYSFTIQKAIREISAALDSDLYLNGGSKMIQVTDNAAGDAPAYTYRSSNTKVATVDIGGNVTPVGVGTATVTVTAAATGNYQAGSAEVAVTVSDLPSQSLAFATPDVVSKRYGDTSFTNAASLTEGTGTVSYQSGDETVAMVDQTTGQVTILKAGSTTITATAATVEGEWAETTASYTLTVAKKAVTVTAADTSKTYGEENPSLTLTIPEGSLVGNDTETALGVTLSTEATRTSDVGSYPITGNASSDNYEVTVTDGTLTVYKAPAPTTTELKVEIAKAYPGEIYYASMPSGLTSTLSDGLQYGTLNYSLDSSDGSWQNLVEGALDDSGILTLIAKELTDESNTSANIMVTVTSTNYMDMTVKVVLTVEDKLLPHGTPTVSNGGVLSYGQKLSDLTLTGTMRVDADEAQAAKTASVEETGNSAAALLAESSTSGTCGAKGSEGAVTWKVERNNEDDEDPTYTLTISGNGAMADYAMDLIGGQYNTPPWVKYAESITNVIVSDGVTHIGSESFGCYYMVVNVMSRLTSVTLGSDIVSIGDGAFANAPITSITIPDSVTTIGKRAFAGTELTFFHIGKNVSMLENRSGLSDGCYDLGEITVDAENPNYTAIDNVLYNKAVTELIIYPQGRPNTSFNVPATVESLDTTDFYMSHLQNIALAENTMLEDGYTCAEYSCVLPELFTYPWAHVYTNNDNVVSGGDTNWTTDFYVAATFDVRPYTAAAQDIRFKENLYWQSVPADCSPFALSATNYTDGGGSISYSSSDETVATVDSVTGLVTPVGEGWTIITVTAEAVGTDWAETEVHYYLEVTEAEDTAVPGTWSWATPDVVFTAGSHKAVWIFTPEDTDTYLTVTGMVEITVSKATPQGEVTCGTISSDGKTLADAPLSGAFINPNNHEAVPGTLIWDKGEDAQVIRGTTYSWTFTPEDTNNYEPVTGSLTPWVSAGNSGGSSGGSSSSSGYAVSVSSAAGGKVTATPTSASMGMKVTLTVTPDDGYELDNLVVKDKNGDEIELTKISEIEYTFTMPSGKVTVTPTFVKREDEGNTGVFTDVVVGEYYYDAVKWAVEKGITTGTSATTFSPDMVCTRAQMVTFLWRVAGSPAPVSAVTPFTDVDSGAYYYDAVRWAVENGITNGTSATAFSPDATLTRSQTVTFLYRYAGSPAVSGDSDFTDVLVDTWYTEAVQWAANRGITNGTGGNRFSPNADCTRAQIVTFLYRDLAE